ncbi:cysteine/Histidine-rich C1 domain family protein [Citrus sinensis]|uniref:Cysteine/Histidine-rich C1 domain family protein n=1 Tax=Citrus sinensis TaxID=2711 RepID=A0ACB8NB87_CITSI|nr:cysteine/Histidine-rich C1 domain family protein [Citrus sinensis]
MEQSEKLHMHVHQHPLSFISEHDYKGYCRRCGFCRYFDESKNCSSCGSRPERCFACLGEISGNFYICGHCDSDSPLFHQSCAELPQLLQTNFHPHCRFRFKEESDVFSFKRTLEFGCDFCDQSHKGYKYCCDLCNFQIGFACAATLIEHYRVQEHIIEHFSHRHPLIRLEVDEEWCRICRNNILGPSYGCLPSSPPPIVEHIHHGHSLTLTLTLPTDSFVKDKFDLFYCDACKEEIEPQNPFCCCIECGYYIHWRCTVIEVPLNDALVHFDHNHFLLPLENGTNDDVPCYACGKVLMQDQNHPTYGCDPCRIYLHKTCAQMPRQIQHVLHRHPLTVTTNDGERGRTCDACQKYLHGHIYKCDSCDFVLDFDCATLQSRVVSEGGDPIYAFVEKLNHTAKCRKYKFAISEASFQDCLKCNFTLHLMLSPLPLTIEHMSHHQHSLTLMDKHADGNYGTQICDVCEEERDQQERVYYCEECDYIADFMCVIEVILALLKKPGDVHLITINSKTSDTIGKVLTFKDIIGGDSDSEKDNTYMDVLNAFEEENRKIRNKISEARHHEAAADVSNSKDFLSDEDFLLLVEDISSLDTGKLLKPISPEDTQSELISLGDYKIIPTFAGVLKGLLKKKEDMEHVQHSGSGHHQQIAFHLVVAVARARYGVDTELYQSSPIRYHHEEMSMLSQKLDELKAEMAVYTQQTQDIISSIRSDAFRLETEKFSNALQLWRMNAGAGLML